MSIKERIPNMLEDFDMLEQTEVQVEVAAVIEIGDGNRGNIRPNLVRPDLTTNAFDKEAFIADHTESDESAQVFSASFGAYAKYVFAKVEAQAGSAKETAQQIMAGIAYNIGVCRALGNENLRVAVITEAA